MVVEIFNIKFDIFIIEFIYGIYIYEKCEEWEVRFCNIVYDIVNRGGRGFIFVFVFGRV